MKYDRYPFSQCMVHTTLFLLSAVVPLLFSVPAAEGIPAFSRQYMTECSTCHTLYPELNEYGQVFLKNGYVYAEKSRAGSGDEGKTSLPGEAPQGDKKVDGLFLTGIPKWIPLSLSANQSLSYAEDAPDGDHWSFRTRDLVLQGGGALYDQVGFYGTVDLYRHDTPRGQDSPDWLDELFIVWRRAFATPINIKLGRFEPKLELWKKSDKIVVTSLAQAAFKSGNSPFSLEKSGDGLELNSVLFDRLFLAAGVVDRKGLSGVDGYGHVSYKFGGADYLGNEPEIDFDSDSIWDYLSMTVAAYGYGGRNVDPFASGIKNVFYRVGSDLDVSYKRGRLRFGIATGRDTNSDYIFPEKERSFLAISSEAEYYLGSPINFVALFRYEYQDDGAAVSRRYMPAVAYIPLQNIKLALQYIHDELPLNTDNRLLLNATFSF